MEAHQAPPSLGFSRQEHWSGLPFPSPVHESETWKWSHSVISDCSRPYGLQPTRLLRPWDFLGKSTAVGCHRLLRLEDLLCAIPEPTMYYSRTFWCWESYYILYFPRNNLNFKKFRLIHNYYRKIGKKCRNVKKKIKTTWNDAFGEPLQCCLCYYFFLQIL